jgi:uncharacterized delta-60 repeat protein
VTVHFRSGGGEERKGRRARRGPWGSIILGAALVAFLVFTPTTHGAGQLDPSFDGDGKVLTDFGGDDRPGDVAIQTDGKIVAAGFTFDESGADFLLARYNPDGSLDSTFDTDGTAVADFGADEGAEDVAIQADGKIVAVGGTFRESGSAFAVARFNPDGSLDPTFGGDGTVVTGVPIDSEANAVAIQHDGKIVAAGTGGFRSTTSFAFVRLKPDGSLDPTFGGDGTAVVTVGGGAAEGAADVAIQTDRKIVAVGSTLTGSEQSFALARLNADGSLDPTFGGDGRVLIGGGFQFGGGVAIQVDGKIVAVGGGSGQFALARLKPDGSLDPSFGGDGRVLTEFGPGSDSAVDVAIQGDDKILAVGQSDGDFALARYKSAGGGLDPRFDGDGRVLTDFGGGDFARGVAIQADDRIVAVGISDVGTNAYDFALARYLPGSVLSRIAVNDVARFEGNAGLTAFRFTVSLSRPSSKTISVSRRTTDGSASAPPDYAALAPATLTFAPGQTTRTVTVNVRGDVAIEPKEMFFLTLSNPTNATIRDGIGQGAIGNDDLSASARCTITGTDGADVLTGTTGRDVICAGNGNDQIHGLDGPDVLKGESGNDLLVGGSGVDLLVGAAGNDRLRGETENDTLMGGDQDDTLNGGAHSDALFGEGGNDSLDARDGVSANDRAGGGTGSDSCLFDPGDFGTSCP